MLMKPFLKNLTWKPVAAAILILYGFTYRDLLRCEITFSHDAAVWYGTFHYFLEQMKNGVFPYWDPYSQMGTHFYPMISGYGLLDPFVFLCVAISKVTTLVPFTLFIYFRLYRLMFFAISSFLLFRYLSKSDVVSAVCAGILLFSSTVQNYSQPMMDYCFTVPVALHLALLLADAETMKKRYQYALALVLVGGLTANVFIPALFLFSVSVFLTVGLLLRQSSRNGALTTVTDRKTLILLVGGLLLVLMMAAPPLSVIYWDAGEEGELFAVGKLVDSNNLQFKAMMASDLGGDRFFDRMRPDQGSFLSWDSIISLLTPDYTRLRARSPSDSAPQMSLYMGVLSPVLICIGLFRIRFRRDMVIAGLVAAGLLLLAAFHPEGVYQTYTPPQRLLNAAFPPLRMLDTRLNFASLITFFLTLVLCLAATGIMSASAGTGADTRNTRRYIAVPLAMLAIKTMLSWYLSGKVFVSAYDAIITAFLLLFALAAVAVRRRGQNMAVLLPAALLLTLADLAYTGTRTVTTMESSAKAYTFLSLKDEYRMNMIREHARPLDGFVYFRDPNVPLPIAQPLVFYSEPIAQAKGAVLSSESSALFTTKRYYDLFSNIPLERQYIINGILFPLVRFYPEQSADWRSNRVEVFNILRYGEITQIKSTVFLEREAYTAPRNADPQSAAGNGNLSWPGRGYEWSVYERMAPFIEIERRNLEQSLRTDKFMAQVEEFTSNRIVLAVVIAVDGYLVYSDGWSSHWKAYDNDEEVKILAANYNSKAVFLRKGEHRVRFEFEPRHYQIALMLCFLGFSIACGLLIFVSCRRDGD